MSFDEGEESGEETIRWFFDPISEDCDEFYYNGKGGNLNNFVTKDLCLSTCKKQAIEKSNIKINKHIKMNSVYF